MRTIHFSADFITYLSIPITLTNHALCEFESSNLRYIYVFLLTLLHQCRLAGLKFEQDSDFCEMITKSIHQFQEKCDKSDSSFYSEFLNLLRTSDGRSATNPNITHTIVSSPQQDITNTFKQNNLSLIPLHHHDLCYYEIIDNTLTAHSLKSLDADDSPITFFIPISSYRVSFFISTLSPSYSFYLF